MKKCKSDVGARAGTCQLHCWENRAAWSAVTVQHVCFRAWRICQGEKFISFDSKTDSMLFAVAPALSGHSQVSPPGVSTEPVLYCRCPWCTQATALDIPPNYARVPHLVWQWSFNTLRVVGMSLVKSNT